MAVQPATRLSDRIDLLDEADSSPLFARGFAQSLEERPDAVGGHPLPHRLERRGRDEHERNTRLLRHRLGQVGLAGARRALEEHPAARRSAELVAEGLISEEDVERPDDLVHLCVQPLDLAEADLHLIGVDGDVGGTAVHERQRNHQEHGSHQQDRRQEDDPVLGKARHVDRVAGRVAMPQVQIGQTEHDDRAQDPLLLGAFLLAQDIGPSFAQKARTFQECRSSVVVLGHWRSNSIRPDIVGDPG